MSCVIHPMLKSFRDIPPLNLHYGSGLEPGSLPVGGSFGGAGITGVGIGGIGVGGIGTAVGVISTPLAFFCSSFFFFFQAGMTRFVCAGAVTFSCPCAFTIPAAVNVKSVMAQTRRVSANNPARRRGILRNV
jgi:hypothetical protein